MAGCELGLMLAYSSDKIRKEQYINNLIRERFGVSFVLIKQSAWNKMCKKSKSWED
jgi:hypothetical protein